MNTHRELPEWDRNGQKITYDIPLHGCNNGVFFDGHIPATIAEIATALQENAKLREMLWLAAEDLDKHCHTCKYLDKERNGCGCFSPITEIDTIRRCCNETKEGWEWRHADKLKELGVEV